MMKACVADMTDNLWVTAFEEAGQEIWGMSGDDLEDLKNSKAKEFDKKMNEVKFAKFRLKVKCKVSHFNDDRRVESQVVGASKINMGTPEEIERLKQSVQRLKVDLRVAEDDPALS